ncbi:MAG: hypothetical protein APF78_06470 [Sphingomonadales bacterium BRH_c3]|nr:MAG: hypothetical protein APF78_06470 [Sphingomonadales bacterium BRH_c3]
MNLYHMIPIYFVSGLNFGGKMNTVLANLLKAKVAISAAASLSASAVCAADFYNQTLDDGSEAIIINGDIVAGDEERFRELSVKYPEAVVALSSFGGALVPALEIGRMIRLRGYTTVVLDGEVCVSSCALIWVAGERRILSEDALVGFHASYIDTSGTKVESGVANALVGHFLSQLNLSQGAVIFATSAAPDEVAWLTSLDWQKSPISFEVYESSDTAQAQIAAPPPIKTRHILHAADASSTYDWFKSQITKPSFAVDGARGIGASGDLLFPLTEHLKLLYAEDSLVRRITEELDAARINPRTNPEAAGTVIFRLSTGSIFKGLARLPQADVNRFFQVLAAAVQVGDDNCQGYLGMTGEANIAEFEKVYALGPNVLDQHLALIRKAIIAEIEGVPKPISLRQDQIAIAENAWAELLAEKLTSRSDEGILRFLEVLENLEAAPPTEACDALRTLYPAISGMEGLAGDWFRRVYISYINDAL